MRHPVSELQSDAIDLAAASKTNGRSAQTVPERGPLRAASNDTRPNANKRTILVTGATGYLGGLIAAGIATDRTTRLILLTRGKQDSRSVAERIAAEADHLDGASDPSILDRIDVVSISEAFTAAAVVDAVKQYPISEIVHCAGCLSYWNQEKLEAGNVQLTEEMLEAGRRLRIDRFVYLSSAFCSGYMQGVVRENLHRSPGPDPTPYTLSKRIAEMRVAESGLPYLMVRPSIVIGDSRHGRYTGKLSGLYQFLWAVQRYLFGRQAVLHLVAPEIPLQVIHQDAFQAGFLAAYNHLGENAIMHLVSREDTLPTVRQLWDTVLDQYIPDCEREYYDHYREIPLDECDTKMRQFLQAVQTNAEICGHSWSFEDRALRSLQNHQGMPFANASFESVAMCHDWFLKAQLPIEKEDPQEEDSLSCASAEKR